MIKDFFGVPSQNDIHDGQHNFQITIPGFSGTQNQYLVHLEIKTYGVNSGPNLRTAAK